MLQFACTRAICSSTFSSNTYIRCIFRTTHIHTYVHTYVPTYTPMYVVVHRALKAANGTSTNGCPWWRRLHPSSQMNMSSARQAYQTRATFERLINFLLAWPPVKARNTFLPGSTSFSHCPNSLTSNGHAQQRIDPSSLEEVGRSRTRTGPFQDQDSTEQYRTIQNSIFQDHSRSIPTSRITTRAPMYPQAELRPGSWLAGWLAELAGWLAGWLGGWLAC